MKKTIKIALTILVSGVLLLSLASFLLPKQQQTKNDDLSQQLDRFNPFVSKEDIYVLTSSEHGTKQSPGGYIYSQDAYKSDGNHYEVSFYAGDELREGAYLKLDAKGVYINDWEEVSQEDLPEKVKEAFTSKE
ncbi:YxeA family protein [Carnobacterium maltaromaticum]|uniref:YxeA family protein n=1 Tax=Carnobacterium maltaromaticum TaxID=2751 RepID=UPI0039AEBAD7